MKNDITRIYNALDMYIKKVFLSSNFCSSLYIFCRNFMENSLIFLPTILWYILSLFLPHQLNISWHLSIWIFIEISPKWHRTVPRVPRTSPRPGSCRWRFRHFSSIENKEKLFVVRCHRFDHGEAAPYDGYGITGSTERYSFEKSKGEGSSLDRRFFCIFVLGFYIEN